MIIRLLEETREGNGQSILKFKTFVTWLSVNSMDADIKAQVLETINFEDFTIKELSSDIRKSGLYLTDKIMERMEELHDAKNEELERNKKAIEE